MILSDHGNGVISHVQCGFNYFNPHGHDGSQEQRHTISIVGSRGSMGLVGYDWDPRGVDFATQKQPNYQRHQTDKGDYVWEQGASLVAECMATGRRAPLPPENVDRKRSSPSGARALNSRAKTAASRAGRGAPRAALFLPEVSERPVERPVIVERGVGQPRHGTAGPPSSAPDDGRPWDRRS
jgi:hypothetical protein